MEYNLIEDQNMKYLMTCTIILAMLLPFGGTAIAAEYEITVDMDETTGGDMEMVETFLETGDDESVPSRSLRRVLMGGVGELSAVTDSRFDENGFLMLDDESLVEFFDEDVLKVRRKLCKKRRADGQCGNATIEFRCKKRPGGNGHRKCQPSYVQICPAAGGSIRVSVPPAKVRGGVRICSPVNDYTCRKCINK